MRRERLCSCKEEPKGRGLRQPSRGTVSHVLVLSQVGDPQAREAGIEERRGAEGPGVTAGICLLLTDPRTLAFTAPVVQ